MSAGWTRFPKGDADKALESLREDLVEMSQEFLVPILSTRESQCMALGVIEVICYRITVIQDIIRGQKTKE